MSFITVIKLLWKYGPTAWSIVSEIWELISKLKDPQEKEAAIVDLDKASQHHKANRDRRRLQALRERLRSRCNGLDCPS